MSEQTIFKSTAEYLTPPMCNVCSVQRAAFIVCGSEPCGECGNSIALCIECGHRMLKEAYELVDAADLGRSVSCV